MSDKSELGVNVPDWEAEAVIRYAAGQAGQANPEVQKMVEEKKKKAKDENERIAITDDARAEAGNQESPRDKFNRILAGRPIDDDIAAGKFPELFKPKK